MTLKQKIEDLSSQLHEVREIVDRQSDLNKSLKSEWENK
jgi:PII-like signaling protein